MGFAFGIACLDCAQNRGAYGLSGGILPIVAPERVLHWQNWRGGHEHPELSLLLPHPPIATDNTSISTNQPIFSMKSPFAGTVDEIDRPCPQLDDWP